FHRRDPQHGVVAEFQPALAQRRSTYKADCPGSEGTTAHGQSTFHMGRQRERLARAEETFRLDRLVDPRPALQARGVQRMGLSKISSPREVTLPLELFE